jgi:hypothetical protein
MQEITNSARAFMLLRQGGVFMRHDQAQRIALLPPIKQFCGPVTRGRLWRLLAIYTGLVGLGSILVFLTSNHFTQTLGLGLMLPGAGFLADGRILFAMLSIITLGVAGVIWFGTGNVLAPPLVWLLAAVLAASTYGQSDAAWLMGRDICIAPALDQFLQPSAADEVRARQVAWLMYQLIGGIGALVTGLMVIRRFVAIRQRKIDNTYLANQNHQLDKIFTAANAESSPEMSLEDLQRLRFALDRALQPLDQFAGFEWLDQFQTAAVRYQLNFLAYGLALTQARFTPAFAGYMHQAQVNLLDKQTQHRVWSYWRLENIWGNLRTSPNPVDRENIMYTGFVALQMVLFEASSGCTDFSNPQRFDLRHPAGPSYACNDQYLIERLEVEYKKSDFFLIACEPNWVYPLCNTLGASAILGYDTLRHKNSWSKYEAAFRNALESEFLDAFGRYVPCRSAYTGLALAAVGGAMPLAMPCFFLNAMAPDLAVRQWLLLRRNLFDADLQFRPQAFWPIDTGNYGFSRASAYAATALAAAELGDEMVYRHCMAALEQECPSTLKDGVIHRQHASVWAHGVEIMARAVEKNSFRDLLLNQNKKAEFYLTDLKYPDVLVASACVEENQLKAVLYPGLQDGRFDIFVGGLQPGQCYRIEGALSASVVANPQGKVSFKIMLQGRTCFIFYAEGK